jgi:hypothetical protein
MSEQKTTRKYRVAKSRTLYSSSRWFVQVRAGLVDGRPSWQKWTHYFYSKDSALEWIKKAESPS